MLLLNSTRRGSVSCRRALLWRSKVKVSRFFGDQRFCGDKRLVSVCSVTIKCFSYDKDWQIVVFLPII